MILNSNLKQQNEDQIMASIDELLQMPNRSLITIAGRSGHGRSFFALYLMDKLIEAQLHKQALYFNLEMPSEVIFERHALLLGAQGNSFKEIMLNARPKLTLKNVGVVSNPYITSSEIASVCTEAATRDEIGVIVVDGIDIVHMNDKYPKEAIAEKLAALAMELNCIIITTIPANTFDIEKNRLIGNRSPLPREVEESIGTFQASNWWLSIDRPQLDTEDRLYKGLFQVRCQKNQSTGNLFSLDLTFVNGRFS
ncbi:DnaB-like helicase C-terminal domain-containing protein [Legionella drancourtii]|uniref:SF4 helicase domain-containing protein n=1 Tax=Legionella drancourtii LLAP12 TaxID=658187 RepID=G9ELJ2_9GAMM|nr:DnaB-like helicase C-terminal domain-containing protein [Legionella drancourtii]EHL31827.1 hypothetical protein LDG_5992 [Legionella drancourtii LLAP12]